MAEITTLDPKVQEIVRENAHLTVEVRKLQKRIAAQRRQIEKLLADKAGS